MLNDSKNILILILCAVLSTLIYFNYNQNEKLQLLNDEILSLADKRKEVIMERYILSKNALELQSQIDSITIELSMCRNQF